MSALTTKQGKSHLHTLKPQRLPKEPGGDGIA